MLDGEPSKRFGWVWQLGLVVLVIGWFINSGPPWISEWFKDDPATAKAATNIAAFTVLGEAEHFKVEGGNDEERDELAKRLFGKMTLHRISANATINPDTDVTAFSTAIPSGYRVLMFTVSDPMGKLRSGDHVDLLLVPVVQSTATPAATKGEEPSVAGLIEAVTVENAEVLQVDPRRSDGLITLLVSIPGNSRQLEALEQLHGRSVAYPLYTVTNQTDLKADAITVDTPATSSDSRVNDETATPIAVHATW